VEGAYLKQLCDFLTQQGSHAPPSLTSARLNVITTALSTTLPALSRVTETPCLCFLLSASLHFGMTVPEPNEFRQLDTFPRLRNCTPKLPCILHPPGCFCAFNCRTVFCRFLCLLFCACSCTVFLFFLRVSSRETIHVNFSAGGILI